MRLIDADEAYKVLTDYYHHRTEIQHEALKEALSKVPIVDAGEVVRCKECRWGTAVEHEFVQGADIRCQQHNCFTNHDSFCSLREKKDGNT